MERLKRRRENHNYVERRRRDNINNTIYEISSLLPNTFPAGSKPNKGNILRLTVDYLRKLQAENNSLKLENDALKSRSGNLKSADNQTSPPQQHHPHPPTFSSPTVAHDQQQQHAYPMVVDHSNSYPHHAKPMLPHNMSASLLKNDHDMVPSLSNPNSPRAGPEDVLLPSLARLGHDLSLPSSRSASPSAPTTLPTFKVSPPPVTLPSPISMATYPPPIASQSNTRQFAPPALGRRHAYGSSSMNNYY